MGHHRSSGLGFLLFPLLLLAYTVGISSGADHVDSRLVGEKEIRKQCEFLGVLVSAQKLPGLTLRAPGKRERFTSTPVLKQQIVTVSMWWSLSSSSMLKWLKSSAHVVSARRRPGRC